MWPEPKFEQICRAVVEGGLVNSVASEPELGSPSRGGLPATHAVPTSDGTGWLINGHKTQLKNDRQQLVQLQEKISALEEVAAELEELKQEGTRLEELQSTVEFIRRTIRDAGPEVAGNLCKRGKSGIMSFLMSHTGRCL